jgi:hypothetical protein
MGQNKRKKWTSFILKQRHYCKGTGKGLRYRYKKTGRLVERHNA